eukprot:5223804-Pleurochrysis_carterae.AAC.1
MDRPAPAMQMSLSPPRQDLRPHQPALHFGHPACYLPPLRFPHLRRAFHDPNPPRDFQTSLLVPIGAWRPVRAAPAAAPAAASRWPATRTPSWMAETTPSRSGIVSFMLCPFS